MGVILKREHLQEDKYQYTWKRDNGDSSFRGLADRIRIDKDEGYEVLHLIATIMNTHNLKTVGDVHRIENILHWKEFSSIIMRDELIEKIEKVLKLK